MLDIIDTGVATSGRFPIDLNRDSALDSLSTKNPTQESAAHCLMALAFATTHRRNTQVPTSKIALAMERHLPLTLGIAGAVVACLVLGIAFMQLRQSDPQEDEKTTDSLFSFGLQMAMDGNFEKSLEIADQLEGSVPARDLLFFRAHLDFQQGHFDVAARTYQSLSDSTFDEKGKAHLNYALCLFQQHRFREAEQEYNQIITTYEGTDPELASKAKIARNIIQENGTSLEKAKPTAELPPPT